MAKKSSFGTSDYRGKSGRGKTSISSRKRTVKFSTMNKSKKRSWKAYSGQGR